MFYSTRNCFFLSLICLVFFLSCSDHPFRESSSKIHSLVEESMKLQKVIETKNIYDEKGNITATRMQYDSTEAKKYLQTKESEILKHYAVIKSYTKKPNEFYYDAIFLLAHFNELLELNAGKPIEDRCIYVRMIPLDRDVVLSSWVTDDLIGSYFYNGYLDMEKKWRSFGYNEKYLYILHFLNSPIQKGRICMNLPDREKYNQFPPREVSE